MPSNILQQHSEFEELQAPAYLNTLYLQAIAFVQSSVRISERSCTLPTSIMISEDLNLKLIYRPIVKILNHLIIAIIFVYLLNYTFRN